MIARALEGAGVSKNSFKLGTFFTILWKIIQPTFENVQSNGFSGGTPKHGQIFYEMLYYYTTLTVNALDSQSSGGSRGGRKFF